MCPSLLALHSGMHTVNTDSPICWGMASLLGCLGTDRNSAGKASEPPAGNNKTDDINAKQSSCSCQRCYDASR